jgi:hypothetical protein
MLHDENKAIFDGRTWHYNCGCYYLTSTYAGTHQKLHLHFVNKHLVYLCFVNVAQVPLEIFDLLMANSYSEAWLKLTTS